MTQHRLPHSPRRDRAWGRFFAARGTARVLSEGARAPSNDHRRALWSLRFYRAGLHRAGQH